MDHREILREALRVLEERGRSYGGVEQSFERAAQLATLKLDRVVTPYEVAIVLESVKDARRAVNPFHFDSHLDGINYRAFAAEFMDTLKAHLPDEDDEPDANGIPAQFDPGTLGKEFIGPVSAEKENVSGQANSP